MKKILMAAAAVVALTAPAHAQFAPTYPVKVPFIQAAIFVTFGKEGNSVDYNPTFKSQVGYNAKVTARAIVKGNLYLRDLIPNHRGVVHAAAWEVVVLDSDPCILWATLLGPQEAFLAKTQSGDNAGGMRIEFNKMPSPRSITQHPRYTDVLHANLPHETWCSSQTVWEDGELKSVSGRNLCRTELAFSNSHENTYRRLDALDYIRTNFCQGMPEPAPRPRLPY